jgi:FlaA1/EpsC-like NDP-sugar epimerase
MIRLRGLRTPADIEIEYIGLRPGEKLHEALLAPDERAAGTAHPRIIRVTSSTRPAVETVQAALRAIEDRVHNQDAEGALDLLTAVLGVHRRRSDAPVTATT